MIFKIIDIRTGKKPSQRVINNIARKGGLIEHDIAGFFVGSDGGLILADECGHYTYVDTNRITAIVTDRVLTDYCKTRKFKLLTERYYRELTQRLYYLEEKIRLIEGDYELKDDVR